MYLLKPISKKRIWGTKRLHEYSGDEEIDTIGSVYTMTSNENFSSEILNGEEKGSTLYDVIKKDPSKFGLKENEPFPIIVSLTGAEKDLSIQVHPTDEFAQKYENALVGKSESWYFIEAPKENWIYAGCKKENKKEIKELIEKGKYKEVVGTYPVKKFDLVFIPSGTLHALTKGSLVYEIQQSTDITYRFFDYDRIDDDGQKRELHLEKAINTLQPKQNIKTSDFKEEKEYDELPYSISRKLIDNNLINQTNVAQVVTNIGKTTTINGYDLEKGASFILLPKEEVFFGRHTEVVVATPNLYWRDR